MVYVWTYSLQKKISKASQIQDLSRVPFVCGYVKFHSVPFMERSTRVNDVIWRKREVKEFLQGENIKTGIRSTEIDGMSNRNTTLNFSCKHQTFPITVKVYVNLNQWHTCIKTTDMQNNLCMQVNIIASGKKSIWDTNLQNVKCTNVHLQHKLYFSFQLHHVTHNWSENVNLEYSKYSQWQIKAEKLKSH